MNAIRVPSGDHAGPRIMGGRIVSQTGLIRPVSVHDVNLPIAIPPANEGDFAPIR